MKKSALVLLVILAGCTPDPPNVVVFIVDDLGWMDTGAYGSPAYSTPAIDQLAAEGVRFSQFYAASPVCSPTRASIMTGMHPARLRITNWIGGEQTGRLLQAPYERQLPLDEMTLGEYFSEAGYRTGYIGKWHLGQEGYKPRDQGFGYTFAVNNAGQPGSYFPPYENEGWPITNVPDLDGDGAGAYLTDRLTDAAVGFLDDRDESPFLLVLSHYSVHTPLQAPEESVDRWASQLPAGQGDKWQIEHDRAFTNLHQDNPTYAAMVESVDRSLARVMATLESSGLGDNTIVLFVSDNGGLSTLPRQWPGMATSNAPLRAGKGWLFEGGIRIPLIVRWTGRLTSGTLVDAPATTTDLVPTLLDLAGLPSRTMDGLSLKPAMTGARQTERPLFWHFPHYHGSGNRPGAAVRNGRHKLILWFEGDPSELYDLVEDPYETTDIAGAEPALVDSLETLLHDWIAASEAAMPSPNPDWDGD